MGAGTSRHRSWALTRGLRAHVLAGGTEALSWDLHRLEPAQGPCLHVCGGVRAMAVAETKSCVARFVGLGVSLLRALSCCVTGLRLTGEEAGRWSGSDGIEVPRW